MIDIVEQLGAEADSHYRIHEEVTELLRAAKTEIERLRQVTDDDVEAGARAYQEWSTPNWPLPSVGNEVADAKRKVARLILEAARRPR